MACTKAAGRCIVYSLLGSSERLKLFLDSVRRHNCISVAGTESLACPEPPLLPSRSEPGTQGSLCVNRRGGRP